MSLIDRLGKEAQRARESRELSDRARRELEETYQKDLQGRLIALHEYIDLIIAHLKEVQPPIMMKYELVGYGDLPALVMHDYKVEGQRRLLSYVIDIQWRARVDHKQCKELVAKGNTRIRQLIDQFRTLHLGGITDIERGEGGHDYMHARFHPRGFIHIGMRATLHAHDPVLRLSFSNLDALNTTHKQFPGEMIDEGLFDLIGRFLVREDNDLITEELPQELLTHLRGEGHSPLIPAAKEWETAPLVAVDLDVDFDPSSVPKASSFDDAESDPPTQATGEQSVAASSTADSSDRKPAAKSTASDQQVQPASVSAQPGQPKASPPPKSKPIPESKPPAPAQTKEQRDRELLQSASPKAPAPDEDRSAELIAEFLAQQGDGAHSGEVKRPDIQPFSMTIGDEEAKPSVQPAADPPEPPAEPATAAVEPEPKPTVPADVPDATTARPVKPDVVVQESKPPPKPKGKPLDLAELEAKRREAEAFRDRMRKMADKLRDG